MRTWALLITVVCMVLGGCGAQDRDERRGSHTSASTSGATSQMTTATDAATQARSIATRHQGKLTMYACQSDVVGVREPTSDASYVPGGSLSVRGCIKDSHGRPLTRAIWDIVRRPPGVRTTMMGPAPVRKNGWYREVNIVHPGPYEIRAMAPGYKPSTKRVLVKEGQEAILDFVLEPEEE